MAIEDRRFYQHGALDYQGIVRASVKDLLGEGNALQGASTLTMQLVNNMYIPESYREHRDLKYKIVQAKLAEQLESKHSKQWILDSYLNDGPVRDFERPGGGRRRRGCADVLQPAGVEDQPGADVAARRAARSRPPSTTRSFTPSWQRPGATRCCRRW